tara:strand:+ start:1077 stop:1295 length:219 start_codon:yes stop_codon:yes gene_type:complete
MEILLSDKYSMIEKQSGMTFEELLIELKRLRGQMKNFKEIQKESNRLDAEYFHIRKMESKGLLKEIEIPNAN